MRQSELPLARVEGKPLAQLPDDLYIPPEALEVFMDAFEGPMDLLLYLIKRQNIDILRVDLAQLTQQYVAYVEAMRAINLELAADYLVMAALLSEIKSRALLPVVAAEDDEAVDDPRAELLRRLEEYDKIVKGAQHIEARPELGVDIFAARAEPPPDPERPLPELTLREMLLCLTDVLRRAQLSESHAVSRESLSTRERMTWVLDQLRQGGRDFSQLLQPTESKAGVVVTFLATLELIKSGLIQVMQTDAFAPLYVQLVEGEAA